MSKTTTRSVGNSIKYLIALNTMNNPSNAAIARRIGLSIRGARLAGDRKIKIPYDIIYDTRLFEVSSPAVTLYHHLQITEKVLQKDICAECGIDRRVYSRAYKELVEKGLLVVQ